MARELINEEECTSSKIDARIVGNIGMFYACYRLSCLGWNVMPTARNARGVDIIAYSPDASLERRSTRLWAIDGLADHRFRLSVGVRRRYSRSWRNAPSWGFGRFGHQPRYAAFFTPSPSFQLSSRADRADRSSGCGKHRASDTHRRTRSQTWPATEDAEQFEHPALAGAQDVG